MSNALHTAMCLLVKKKFPEKFERYFGGQDYTSVWIRSHEQYDKIFDDYYCLYCDEQLDINYPKLINDHALQHLRDNKLLAFL